MASTLINSVFDGLFKDEFSIPHLSSSFQEPMTNKHIEYMHRENEVLKGIHTIVLFTVQYVMSFGDWCLGPILAAELNDTHTKSWDLLTLPCPGIILCIHPANESSSLAWRIHKMIPACRPKFSGGLAKIKHRRFITLHRKSLKLLIQLLIHAIIYLNKGIKKPPYISNVYASLGLHFWLMFNCNTYGNKITWSLNLYFLQIHHRDLSYAMNA